MQQETEQQRAWEQTCSEAITSDVLWKLDAYRAALFLVHLARTDCRSRRASATDDHTASQLMRAAGSIGANLAEGYSRATRVDRLRFLGYALSSVGECVVWYEVNRDELSDGAVDDRLHLLARLRALMLGLIRSLRADGGGPDRLER
jgi:four helix bundle protein